MESGRAGEHGAPVPRPPFERFGRYVLVEHIATGGMAEVHRAVVQGAQGFRRTFVIKRILADKASSPSFIRMFCEEARVCAALHHPNIVQVHDFGQVQGSYFLAMEYLHGKDLWSLARAVRAANAAMPPGLATYVAREAAVGLHYAHTLRGADGQGLGIVHRDVSPSNIMLLFAGGVKLLDFGIAQVAKVASPPGESETLKGKYGYLAPEQVSFGGVDARADIFALGVTLWEMLVGRRLFKRSDDRETLRNVLLMPVPPPSSLRPSLPAALDRIVLRALERKREERYATADELARDCDGVLASLRADSQTLRAFLGALFAGESSAPPIGSSELPAAGTEPSNEVAAARPEPPSAGVARSGRRRRARWAVAPVLATAALACAFVGVARQRRAAAPRAETSARALAAVRLPALIVPLAERPVEVTAAGAGTELAAAASASATADRARPARRGSHRRLHRSGLSHRLTLNPFRGL